MSPTPAAVPNQNLSLIPEASPLNEAVWQAWVLKGQAQEERTRRVWQRAVRLLSLAGLLLAVASSVWPFLLSYDVVARFAVAAGATVVMSQAFKRQAYVVGILFGALVLLYNPIEPVFQFKGVWQSALVVLSAFPFIVSRAQPEAGGE